MNRKISTLSAYFVYIVFFFSGFAGLIYELVWSRQLLLIFGNTSYSLAAVLSAYMAGLGLGSLAFGKLSDKTNNFLRFYALLEIGISIFALSTLYSFSLLRELYGFFILKELVGQNIVIPIKFILSFMTIFPATFLMGGTLPALVKYFAGFSSNAPKEVAKLYFVNTLGAAVGVIVCGLIFIEMFGLKGSLILASCINMTLGISVLSLYRTTQKQITIGIDDKSKSIRKRPGSKYILGGNSGNLILVVFGISSVASLAYEVLWVRILTPALGTYIYAFTIILAVFLFGIALGSYLFEKYLIAYKRTLIIFGFAQFAIGLSSLFTLFINIHSNFFNAASLLFFSILPGTIFMGMTLPIVSETFKDKGKVGENLGLVYLINTLGNILGSIIATFVLIPYLGSGKSIILLSMINFFLAFKLMASDNLVRKKLSYSLNFITTGVLLSGLVIILFIPKESLLPGNLRYLINRMKNEENSEVIYKEDEAASVIAYGGVGTTNRNLIIDGVATTNLGPETSLLAHIPLLLHPNARNMLIIALGMGNTFRSALLHKNVKADVVELVPSVTKVMYLFHDDYSFASDTRGRIFINDGRNYVRTTNNKYDVIVVDPPPPLNSAGTTVLYSKEFYQDALRILRPDGVFVAWIYFASYPEDLKMLFRSFAEVFPYILVFKPPTDTGYYLVGSLKRTNWNAEDFGNKLREQDILDDINRSDRSITEAEEHKLTSENVVGGFVGTEDIILRNVNNVPAVTDDRPLTEYFLIRRLFSQEQNRYTEANQIKYLE